MRNPDIQTPQKEASGGTFEAGKIRMSSYLIGDVWSSAFPKEHPLYFFGKQGSTLLQFPNRPTIK